MAKTPELSRKEPFARARKQTAAERERRLKLIREIAKKRQLLRSAKAEERTED